MPRPSIWWAARSTVGGSAGGFRRGAGGWVLPVNPRRLRDGEVAIGGDVTVQLAPEGPQCGDLADDIATALAASPAAGAFFDTLAQFYRKAYLRWIDANTRRPDVRAGPLQSCAARAGSRSRPAGRAAACQIRAASRVMATAKASVYSRTTAIPLDCTC